MAQKINKKLERELTHIAMKHNCILEERGDLKARNNDSEDFFDMSIWGIEAMLHEAYELGLKRGLEQAGE